MLNPFAPAVWTATTPIRFAGTWFPHVMTVLRLTNGEILLHSPCQPSDDLVQEISRIGEVTHIVAPNWFHDLYLLEYRALYRDATFWAPAFLRRQRKAIVDRVLDGSVQPPWFADLPYISLHGLLTFDECLFFHVATRTLIVADLLMNTRASNDAPPFTKLGYRFFGLDGRLKVFPILRWLGIGCRPSLRQAVRQVFEWNPERLIVSHGTPVEAGAREQLRTAFRWLGTAGSTIAC